MIVICLQCRDKEHKILARELQVQKLSDSMCRILIAANGVLQGTSGFDAETVLLAIAGEAAKFVD